MSVCPVDKFKELVEIVDGLAEYSSEAESGAALSQIADGIEKLRLIYNSIYQLETCNKVCPHDIQFCHCPVEARDIKGIEQRLKNA